MSIILVPIGSVCVGSVQLSVCVCVGGSVYILCVD